MNMPIAILRLIGRLTENWRRKVCVLAHLSRVRREGRRQRTHLAEARINPPSTRRLVPVPAIARRAPLATEVYDQLLRKILRGSLAPGATLPSERAFATQLGVNRNVVREALKRLEHAGLIEIRHGGATQVLDFRRHGGLELLSHIMTMEDDSSSSTSSRRRRLRELMELRSVVAESAARLAAERRRVTHVDALRKHVRYMREAGSQVDVLARNAIEFWREVISATDNFALELAWSTIHRALVGEAIPTITKRSIDDHHDLVDAIDQRDAETAALLARRLAQHAHPPSSRSLIAAAVSSSTPRKRSTVAKK